MYTALADKKANLYGVLLFLTHRPGEMRLPLNIKDIQNTVNS